MPNELPPPPSGRARECPAHAAAEQHSLREHVRAVIARLLGSLGLRRKVTESRHRPHMPPTATAEVAAGEVVDELDTWVASLGDTAAVHERIKAFFEGDGPDAAHLRNHVLTAIRLCQAYLTGDPGTDERRLREANAALARRRTIVMKRNPRRAGDTPMRAQGPVQLAVMACSQMEDFITGPVLGSSDHPAAARSNAPDGFGSTEGARVRTVDEKLQALDTLYSLLGGDAGLSFLEQPDDESPPRVTPPGTGYTPAQPVVPAPLSAPPIENTPRL